MEYEQEFYSPCLDIEDYPEIISIVDDLFSELQEKTRKNIVLYVANIIAYQDKIAVMRENEWFSKKITSEWHTYTRAIKAQNALLNKGFIDIKLGHPSKEFKTGFASRLLRTKKFQETFGHLKPKPITINDEYKFDILFKDNEPEIIHSLIGDEVISELKDVDTHYYIKLNTYTKEVIQISLNPHTYSTLPLESSLLKKRLIVVSKLNNKYFNRIFLSLEDNSENMLKEVYLTRIYSRMGCGRFYQQNGKSYQNIERESRKKLLINGKPTIEVDYSAMHVNLLYNRIKKTYSGKDAYMPVVEKLLGKKDDDIRKIVKQCILIAINAKDMNDYQKAMRRENKLMVAKLKEQQISLEQVIITFQKVHTEIAHFLNSDYSIELMFKDSNIIENVLLKLMNEDILGVPLHDSIICQRGQEERVKAVMQEAYKEKTGFYINVEVK